MVLNASIIKKRFASVPWKQKDNEAQNIINGATFVELKNLDVEAVLRLYQALIMLSPRIYSANDAPATKKQRTKTQFQPIHEDT